MEKSSPIKELFYDGFGIETKEEKQAKKNAKEAEQNPTPDEEKKEKEFKWKDVNDPVKFVIMGGKAQCAFCSNPEANIIVTANDISLQDKPWATIGDSDGKTNFAFTGVCNHPSQQKPLTPPPPCKTVIKLGKWKNFSNTMVNNDNALLMQSKIPCMISGQDIIITDSGQKTTLSEIEPQMSKDPKITKLYWMDKEEKEIIKMLEYGQETVLFVETEDFRLNQKITIPVKDDETEEKYELSGRLDGFGKTKIKWTLPIPLDKEAYSNFVQEGTGYGATGKENAFEIPIGYYYQDDGTFLGKTGNSENVYITDKATFNRIKNNEKVEPSRITAFTEKHKLNNKELLDRANWAFGEGGGYILERYTMTIENLKKSGKSGYGPTPFASEEEMYKRTMLHGSPAKCLYPQYFNGTFGAEMKKDGKIIQYQNSANKFALARKSTDYSALNADTKMKSAVKAVIDSLLGKLTNEGYNNWRGSGDTLYTVAEKNDYIENFKQPKDQDLVWNDKNKTVYAKVKTTIDHFWEPVGNKFRRHSFYKIKREMVK